MHILHIVSILSLGLAATAFTQTNSAPQLMEWELPTADPFQPFLSEEFDCELHEYYGSTGIFAGANLEIGIGKLERFLPPGIGGCPSYIKLEAGFITGDTTIPSGEYNYAPSYSGDIEISDELLRIWSPIPYPQGCRFLIRIPAELAGKRMAVRAVVNSPEYGRVEGRWGAFHAVAPCSRADSTRILMTSFSLLQRMDRTQDAIELADSALAVDLVHPKLLERARNLAEGMRDYVRAIHYLDEARIRFVEVQPPLRDFMESSVDSAKAAADYESLRRRLSEKLQEERR